MGEDLLTEIRKLEVRLQEYIEAEQKATESLRKWINKLKNLHSSVSKIKEKPELTEKMLKLRLESIKAFHDALKEISKAEHEKSHLLESYGAILTLLEEWLSRNQGKSKGDDVKIES